MTKDMMGLPPRTFLYTLDQIAQMIEVELPTLRSRHIHFEGRSVGKQPLDRMLARDISSGDDPPEWRVAENEILRWLKKKGFRVTMRGWVSR